MKLFRELTIDFLIVTIFFTITHSNVSQYIFPFLIVFVIYIVLLIFRIILHWKQEKNDRKNDGIEIRTEHAVVYIKEIRFKDGLISWDMRLSRVPIYKIYFFIAEQDAVETFSVPYEVYAELEKREYGVLTYQGTQFISFIKDD